MSKEAMKLALEVKESMEDVLESVNALVAENKALKEALAKQEQGEPFGYFKAEPFGWTDCAETDKGAVALYEASPQRTWVGLTDEERKDLFKRNEEQFYDELNYAEAIEAKLKEKNT
jgi:hypothetical protein